MGASCLHCAVLSSCPILSDVNGNFVPERILEDTADIHCDRWRAMGPRERRDRDRLYKMSGMGSLRALHVLPPKNPDAELLREKEVVELKVRDDIPDFNGMRKKGMTASERRAQLLYETNEAGEVLYTDFDGEPTPKQREQYQLRKYACDPEGPIKLDARSSLFWTMKEILNHIIREETNQKLIVRDPKSGVEDNNTQSEETNMAKGKRVIVRNTGKGKGTPTSGTVPNKAVGGKVAKPPRTVIRGNKSKKPEDTDEGPTPRAPAPAKGLDLGEVVASLNGLHERLDGIEQTIAKTSKGGENGGLAESFDKLVRALGVWHDIMVLSGGEMQAIPAQDENGEYLYDDDGNLVTSELMPVAGTQNGLLSYVDGPGDDTPFTAYIISPPPEEDDDGGEE